MIEPASRALGRAPDPTPMQIGRLHHAATHSDEGPAVLLALCCVVGCDAARLAAVRVEDVDRSTGTFRVGAADGAMVTVAVGMHGAVALHNAIGVRSGGFLVPSPHGGPLEVDADTLGYAEELVRAADPSIDFLWSFRSVREGLLSTLIDEGVPYGLVETQAGLPSPRRRRDPAVDVVAQRAVCEWWSLRAGLRSVSPFDYIDLAAMASDAKEENERLRRGGPRP